MPTTFDDAIIHLKHLGFHKMVYSNVVLVQEALERGIHIQKSASGRSILLQNGNRKHWWRGGNCSLNTNLMKRVSLYKSATNALLRAQGINTANSQLFEADDLAVAWLWAQKYGSVVLKPDAGQGGSDVFVGVSEEKDFAQKFEYIAARYGGKVIIEPYFAGDQYRCLAVNGKVVAVSWMRPASIVGDGKSKISKLVRMKNKERKNHESHEPLLLTDIEESFLATQGLSKASIPAEGERVFISNISNLQRGGDSIDATGTLSEVQQERVQEVISALPGMKLGGIDLMFNVEGQPSQTVVLEVNTSPQLSIHHFPWEGEARNVAANVVDTFFPETAKVAAE